MDINLIVGLGVILLVLWLIMYIIPSFFVYLFNTLLGQLILLLIVLGTGYYKLYWGIGLAIIFIILYRFDTIK